MAPVNAVRAGIVSIALASGPSLAHAQNAPAQNAVDATSPAQVRALLDARAWARAASLGRAYLAADTTRSSDRCRVLEGVAYAEFGAEHRDSAAVALASFEATCRDVPLERALRAEVAMMRRALAVTTTPPMRPTRDD